MSTMTRSFAFCADYSETSACLFAIQALEKSGGLDAEALRLLSLFEKDVLRKLYLRTLRILGVIDNVEEVPKLYIGGDFSKIDFSGNDFHIGYLVVNPSHGSDNSLLGDFETEDFSYLDFFVGYKDTRNESYSSTFQTILNIFKVFCSRSNEISDAGKAAIDAALIPVLEAIEAIQQYLADKGLNPCGDLEGRYINNSPSVYLQVAGSDGISGIAEGLHLRWSLAGALGDNHLPKGKYNNTTGAVKAFNKPDDYAYITRTPYTNPVRVNIDFANDVPVINFNKKEWTYTINQTAYGKQITNRIKLSFTNPILYNQLATTLDPSVGYTDFLNRYTDVISIEVMNKTAFMVGLDFYKQINANQAVLKVEAGCQAQHKKEASDLVNIRKTCRLEQNEVTPVLLSGENIRITRIKKSPEGRLKNFYFETYHDFMVTRDSSSWTPVGSGFSLSLEDAEVFDRLENQSYPIDKRWPHYNDGTTVRIDNYKEKWSFSGDQEQGLKHAVAKYLSLSETDPRAMDVLQSDVADIQGLTVSYLDILNLHAMDYHMARMLGLGYIDTPANAGVNDHFVYKLNYTNRKSADLAELMDYNYISLPVSKADQLLPEKPKMRAISYGLPESDSQVSNGFDEQGYIKVDNVRAVNIGRELYPDELENHNFFADLLSVQNENIFEHAKPVLYGVEYRAANQHQYVKPEITHDKSFGKAFYAYDTSSESGVLETVPVPDHETSLYIHFERSTGVHFYAIYGINWFSRASEISEEAGTNATAFPVRNNLVPPTDVTVQYIQKEDERLFTTSLEQTWLNGRAGTFPGKDINFSRVTFNWLDVVDVSHLTAISANELAAVVRPDQVKAYFKPGLPMEVTGVIKNIVPVPGSEHQVILHTGRYALIDGTVVRPSVASEDLFRFKNSLLSTPAGQFHVISVAPGTDGPVITVEKAFDLETITDQEEQPEEQANFAALRKYITPEINSRFSMVENLSNAENWKQIEKTINLISFADVHQPEIESAVDVEGNVTKQWIGGINGNAVVIPLFDGSENPDNLPGYYKVTFDQALPAHPQVNLPYDPSVPNKNNPAQLSTAHVEWYKGHVRIPFTGAGTDKKLLEVMTIRQTNPLELYVYDPNYLDAPIVASANDRVKVNFHPGYKAYLFPEPAPVHAFNGEALLPAGDENDRKSLFGLQAVDTHSGNGFVSSVSVPSVLLARRIEEPVQFEAPFAPGLKVRPDATGKAAFTFDTKIAAGPGGTLRKPFGFMFYRTSLEEVIRTFYKPETIETIFNDLAKLTEDPLQDLRAYELVNLVLTPGNALQFRTFQASPAPYGFPVPDKAGLFVAGDTLEQQLGKLRTAIYSTLLPLTEQPPIFNFIRQGTQTENALPVIRDVDGNLLSASSPDFNPFPMVRRYSKPDEANVSYIRFTDYVLNASSRNLYFYAGAEVTNQLMPGPLSGFTGPVTVLQTAASAAPLISRFTIQDSLSQLNAVSVVFNVAAMSPDDHISKIRVYRTTTQSKSHVLETMDSHFDVDVMAGAISGYVLTDNFSNLPAIPVGETVYYRFVGVRMIINESGQREEVLSAMSEVVDVKLIDTVNPVAPELTYDATRNTLSWQPTTGGGTYHLFKQNKSGNWERIYNVEPPATVQVMHYLLPTPLVHVDADGNPIYNRFKVQVQNSSGLFNLTDKEATF